MLTHGGDIVGFKDRYGVSPLDFSVNTNPFGLSPRAREALSNVYKRCCEYPDPLYRNLRAAIAEHENVPMQWITCANGAADIIWRIAFAKKPRKALVTAPTFSEYETALRAVGCQTEHHILTPENGFILNEQILDKITPDTDIVFICNPNNPTGLLTKSELLLAILERCRLYNALTVVDECFLGFLPNAGELTLKPQLEHYKNLIILKAFTKLYGMAGLRLGYCLSSNGDLLSAINENGQCWSVSIAAEEAGIAALGDKEFVESTVAYIADERQRVLSALAHLGFTVYPSAANYLFFHSDIPDLHELLAQKGLLIRNCSNYIGLGDGYYRVAVLTRNKNDALLSAMEHIRRLYK